MWGAVLAGIYGIAFLSSVYVPFIAAFFYLVGLYYFIASVSTTAYTVIYKPYSASVLLKGVPLLLTFTLPAVLLMLASASASSYLPFSAYLNSLRS